MLEPAKRYSAPIDILKITPEAVAERLSYRLRLVVGPGRAWSYQELSGRTGIDVRTLKAYVQATACPNLVKYKQLLAVLGPEIGAELNVMKGWLPRSDAIPPEVVDVAQLREELSQVTAIIRDLISDDHDDLIKDNNSTQTGSVIDKGLDDELLSEVATIEPIPTVLDAREIDLRAVVDRLSPQLRQMIGPDQDWEFGEVSERTGIDPRTLQSYLDGTACPNLARFLRLSHLLGPKIGFQLATMIGWEPRYGTPQHVDRGDIERLCQTLSDAQDAMDRVLKQTPESQHGVRFLRRGDRLSVREKDGAQSEIVIPFGFHR
ncbi:MAG: hypothetical protein AAGF25_06040 [Pseudomonadota bacterium]